MHQERHENTRPKWQGYVGTGGREACKMEFRIGSRVIRAEESQGASLHSVTEEASIHFGKLIGTSTNCPEFL